ncbi:kinase-like domain-containing protein [Circinella umbellata]|nr:kinase-like domain-containing protein [Circinella umbellata]
MSQVKTDKSNSSMTNVSSPLRFELLSTSNNGKRSFLQSQDGGLSNNTIDDSIHMNEQHNTPTTSPILKRSRLDLNNNESHSPPSPSSPSTHLLRKMLTPTRSAMSETSNLFDQSDIITQERLKSGLNSSDIEFSSPSARFVTQNKLIDRDKTELQLDNNDPNNYNEQEEEEVEELPLYSFGWPGFGDDDVDNEYNYPIADDEDEEEQAARARRSLLSEFKSSEIVPLDGYDEEEEEERLQSSRNLTYAVMGDISEEDDNDEGQVPDIIGAPTTIPILKNDHHYHPQQQQPSQSKIHYYDDDVDELFSNSHVEDNITTQLLPSSSLRRNYGPSSWQHIKPAFLTTQPRFLTKEYFQQHDPTSCMQEEDQEEEEFYEDEVSISYFQSKYETLGNLGSGEYADVFKVQHVETGHIWALKKTKLQFASYDDRWQQIIEVDHMRAVSGCKQCVELTDAWEQEGILYIQMELCVNGSLAEYIKYHNRNIPESDVWSILYELAQGVKAIHDANIIHLDLKPSNVLINDMGSIKIGDFGVSVREPVDLRWVKGEGDRRYMAPDLLRDQFHKPADIFSLGLIVLEMAAGIELPDTGEPWEELRIADFSGCEEALNTKTSTKMREFIEWLMQTNAKERPTIDQVLKHPELASKKLISSSQENNTKGILFDYIQELQQRRIEQEEKYDNDEPILFDNDILQEEGDQTPHLLLPPPSPLPSSSPLCHQ